MIGGRLSRECGTDILATPAIVVMGVRISDLAGNRHPEGWPALVDTGADRTVIPLSVCQDLKLAPRDRGWPRGFDRQAPRRATDKYYVRIGVGGAGEAALMVYAVQRSSVLLGRDFLAGRVLLMDGQASKWQMGRPGFWMKMILRVLSLS
jgi:hypothetical protein